MTVAFADLPRRAQLRRLAAAADRVLERYDLGDHTRKLVVYEFNATYRIDTERGRFALRINVNSPHRGAAVRAEATWVDELARSTEVRVPRPQPTRDGALSTTVTVEGLDHDVGAVMYSWLAGPDLGGRASATRLHAVGAAMARLHHHTSTWIHPDLGARPAISTLFMDEQDEITGDSRIAASDARLLSEAMTEMERILAPVFAGPSQLLHADLHMWNTKWVDGDIAVIDFDDAGIGAPIQDLAIAAFYVRDRPDVEAAIRAGYESIRPLPAHTDEQFETLVANRNLLLLNSIMTSNTADMIEFVPEYAERTVRRLRGWLETGVFSH
ncbi:MAG: phosphotransferase [Actinomycetota bacterium]